MSEHIRTLPQRVAAGVEFLDAQAPGWWERIDLESFRLNSCARCVLGQMFGRYSDGIDELGISYAKAESMGFDRPHFEDIMGVPMRSDPSDGLYDTFDTYIILQAYWEGIVRHRRQEAARAVPAS